VEAWFAEHPEVIPASGTSTQALTNQVNALSGVVSRMTTQGTEQVTQRGQATLAAKDEITLRHELRALHMKAIVNVANALRGQVPGVGVVRMPAFSTHSESLVKSAEALFVTASVYKDVFVEHGLPADFLDQLAAATSALKSSIDARGVALSKRTGATTSVAGDHDLGRRIVSMIDASLTHVLKSDPVTLASWRQAKRVTRKSGVARSVSTAAPAASGGASTATGAAPLALVESPSASAHVPVAQAAGMAIPVPETAAA
jgi:hypothetical protein